LKSPAIGLVALGVLAGSAAAAVAPVSEPPALGREPAQALALYSEPELVALPNGRRIALYCEGAGSPLVVFEAGAGNEAAIWSKVQPAVSRSTRTCSYDRAGYGFSDLDRGPRDAEHVSAELYETLKAAGEAGPYLLVGHSLGGFFMRMFATRYRDEVVGMVLVDPMIDGGHAPLEALAPTYARYVANVEARYERCLRPTALGEMKPGSAIYLACGSPPVGPQTDPKRAEAGLLEQAGMKPSSDQVVKAEVPFGDLPLIVLSRDPLLDGAQAWPPAERDAYRRAWTEGHRAIAALSAEGVEREVKGADHGIHQTRPEAVIEAVEAVLSRARERMKAKPDVEPAQPEPGPLPDPVADAPQAAAD
jgi:pimeloyl-ACP methyl ester carboxylesterase